MSTARVVLIVGDEIALRRKALTDAMAGLQLEPFDIEVTIADQQSKDTWWANASTVPFLSERRVVIVRNLSRAKEPPTEKDISAMKSLPESALAILVVDDELSADEDRAGRLRSAGQQWVAAVKKAGGSVIDCSLKDARDIQSKVRAEAKQMGANLSPQAAETLIEMCGGNYSRCLEELEKLILFVGAAGEIREADVRAVVTPSREWNVFRLADAVVAGQHGGALRQLQILVTSSAKAEEAANRSILPNLSRQFKLIWQARYCLDAGINPTAVPEAIAKSWPEKPNLATESQWARNRAVQAARKTSLIAVEACLREVADADARLKGLKPAHSAYATLEQLILSCSDLAGRP